MAAALGSLVVSLGLDAAEFVDGLTRSEYQARRFVRDLTGATTRAVGTFAAIGASAAAALSVLGRAADTIAVYQDLGDQIGDTAENVAALQSAADISGTALESVASASVKLTAALAKADDESKGVGAALKAIGIEFEAFRDLDPVAQLEQVALQLAKFEDGAQKTAVATALFGRAGAELIPFLNDLAEAGGRQVRLSQEQIRAADEYSKAYARITTELSAVAQVAVAESIPAATALASELGAVAKAILGINEESGRLRAGNAVRDFAADAAVAIAVVVEGAVGAAKAIRAIGGSFQAVAADIAQAFETGRAIANFGPAQGIAETAKRIDEASRKRDAVVREANQRYIDLWNYDGTRISTAIRQALSAEQQILNRIQSDPRELARRGRAPAQLPTIDIPRPSASSGGASAKAVSEAERYLESLQRQLQATQDLSVAETVLADIRAGRLGRVSQAQQDELLAVAQQIDAARRLQSQLQAEAQQERDLATERKRIADEARQTFEATRTPIERLNIELARQQALLDELGPAYRDTYERAVFAAQDAYEATLRIPEALQKTDTMANDLGLTFTSAFENAIVEGGKLRDLLTGLEQDIIRIVTRNLVTQPLGNAITGFLQQGIGASLGGIFGGLFGGLFGGGGGGFASLAGISGGRANGGPVYEGGMYRVAENRPEMLDVNGQKFLLMGRNRGSIDPNPRFGRGGGISAPITINVQGNVDRRTASQIGSEAARKVAAMNARFN